MIIASETFGVERKLSSNISVCNSNTNSNTYSVVLSIPLLPLIIIDSVCKDKKKYTQWFDGNETNCTKCKSQRI